MLTGSRGYYYNFYHVIGPAGEEIEKVWGEDIAHDHSAPDNILADGDTIYDASNSTAPYRRRGRGSTARGRASSGAPPASMLRHGAGADAAMAKGNHAGIRRVAPAETGEARSDG